MSGGAPAADPVSGLCARMADMDGQLDLFRKRIAALHRLDERGRLVEVNQWNGGAAARFFLMRTPVGALCRCRADLPDELVLRLEDLCAREPRQEVPARLPAWRERYLELLEEHAPVHRIWAGPAYIVAPKACPSTSATPIGENNAHLLRGDFEDWLPDIPHQQPFLAVLEGGPSRSARACVFRRRFIARVSRRCLPSGEEAMARVPWQPGRWRSDRLAPRRFTARPGRTLPRKGSPPGSGCRLRRWTFTSPERRA